jgi:hypothetical protein
VEVGRIDWVSHYVENSSIRNEKMSSAATNVPDQMESFKIAVLAGTFLMKQHRLDGNEIGKVRGMLCRSDGMCRSVRLGRKRRKELHGRSVGRKRRNVILMDASAAFVDEGTQIKHSQRAKRGFF